MEVYKVKKLYKGHASVREYTVNRCISQNQPLQIMYENKVMTVKPEVLQHRFRFHRKQFKSHFNNKEYGLIDFLFTPDTEIIVQAELFK